MNVSYNTSNITNPIFHSLIHWKFLFLEIETSVMTAITIYLIASFSLYEYKKKVGRKLHGAVLRRTYLSREQNIPVLEAAMRIELLASLLFLLGRFICEHCELLLHYFKFEVDICDVSSKMKFFLTTLSSTAVYSFLWTRQRSYYAEPAIRNFSNKAVRIMSNLSLLLLFVGNTIGLILCLVFRSFYLSDEGCVTSLSPSPVPTQVPWILMTGNAFVVKLLLFLLFIYPLSRHKQIVPTSGAFHCFLPLIKRTTIITVVCIVSELCATAFVVLINNHIMNFILPGLLGVVGIVCMFMTFRDWMAQLFAPFLIKNENIWN